MCFLDTQMRPSIMAQCLNSLQISPLYLHQINLIYVWYGNKPFKIK